jgi:hypothetical protein
LLKSPRDAPPDFDHPPQPIENKPLTTACFKEMTTLPTLYYTGLMLLPNSRGGYSFVQGGSTWGQRPRCRVVAGYSG